MGGWCEASEAIFRAANARGAVLAAAETLLPARGRVNARKPANILHFRGKLRWRRVCRWLCRGVEAVAL